MSIDIKSAKIAIDKLTAASLTYPPAADGLAVLAKSLGKHAKSERHAELVIDGWIEHWPQWPKPSELVQLCGITDAPEQAQARSVRESCHRCGGSGWISVDGPYGTSAAYPCSHNNESEADRRAGVRISPALHRHYGALSEAAEPDRDRWTGSGGKPAARATVGQETGKAELVEALEAVMGRV